MGFPQSPEVAITATRKKLMKLPCPAWLASATLSAAIFLLSGCEERYVEVPIAQLEQRRPFRAVVERVYVEDFGKLPSGVVVVIGLKTDAGERISLGGTISLVLLVRWRKARATTFRQLGLISGRIANSEHRAISDSLLGCQNRPCCSRDSWFSNCLARCGRWGWFSHGRNFPVI